MNDQDSRIRLVVITGPTAVGKTGIAIDLASRFGGEIISADSMQVYRYMNIGTAKPDPDARRRAPHHLIDVVDPDEEFNAALFMKEAGKIIRDLDRKGKNIFVVGGTGLYIRALLGGLFEGPGSDRERRAAWMRIAESFGREYLFELLREQDYEASRKIHPHDTARVIRALEIVASTGESIITKQREHDFGNRSYDSFSVGLRIDREELYGRIDRRVDEMIRDGLVSEVEALLDRGYEESVKPLQSMCYRHVVAYLKGRIDLDESVRLIKRDTRHYAKRQLTWFKKDESIRWADPGQRDEIAGEIETFLH